MTESEEAMRSEAELGRPGPRTVLHGGLMGLTDAVPGVSGGTVALILGIHPRLVGAIAKLRFGLLRFLWEARKQEHRPAWREAARRADLGFLTLLASGLVVGLFLGANALVHLLERYPQPMAAAFLALVLAGIPVPLRHADTTWRGLWIALIAAMAAYAVTIAPVLAEPNMWALPLYGALAACAMILPGISGSFVLLILGAYPLILGGVAELDVLIIGLAGFGAVTGLLLFTRGLRFLLTRHEGHTHAAMVGLLVGSLGRLWPWRSEPGFAAGAPIAPEGAWLGVLLGALGGLAVGWIFTALAESE